MVLSAHTPHQVFMTFSPQMGSIVGKEQWNLHYSLLCLDMGLFLGPKIKQIVGGKIHAFGLLYL